MKQYKNKSHLKLLIIIVMFIASGFMINAQDFTFDSGSDGSDGALNLTEAGILEFNPLDFDPPLDPDGDNIYHFTTINVGADVTVKLAGNILGSNPVIWLATAEVTIAGTLDLNGEDGHGHDVGVKIDSKSGAGGYGGGKFNRRGNGPGGGYSGRQGGGGGHVTNGSISQNSIAGGPSYGNSFLLPLIGGSGGGGGEGSNAGGGGAGGGAILIVSSLSISINGQVLANGGAGGGGLAINGSAGWGGGGGSGGAIRCIAPIITGNGTLSANFGNAGKSGGRGAIGRIRIEVFQASFSGTVVPPVIVSTPGFVFLSNNVPPVSVVSIDGKPVPANPNGTFSPADIVIDNPGTTTLAIEAHDIPLGNIVKVTMYNETEGTSSVDSSPLEGTLENSTATATLQVPHGFNRFFVEANWDPTP